LLRSQFQLEIPPAATAPSKNFTQIGNHNAVHAQQRGVHVATRE